jgi:uncharacterized protein YegL
MNDIIPVLKGNIMKRTLHFFWIADCSGSMSGRKISTLNQAIREAIPSIKEALSAHPEVQILMRAIKFSDQAEWHVGPEAVPLDDFTWPNLDAEGITATAQALDLLADELAIEKMAKRGYPPVCLLLSDGYCTDNTDVYNKVIERINATPWGKKAVRLAIGIGDEHEYNEHELLKFVTHKEVGVLKADSPEKLTSYIKWASVAASIGASVGKSRVGEPNGHHIVLPPPPEEVQLADLEEEDVF